MLFNTKINIFKKRMDNPCFILDYNNYWFTFQIIIIFLPKVTIKFSIICNEFLIQFLFLNLEDY